MTFTLALMTWPAPKNNIPGQPFSHPGNLEIKSEPDSPSHRFPQVFVQRQGGRNSF